MSQKDAVFASTSSDGTVNVWELVFPCTGEGEWQPSQLFHVHAWNCRIMYHSCRAEITSPLCFSCHHSPEPLLSSQFLYFDFV